MSETRKNHLTIDGGQVKEEENVSSYKPIPESETEFRSSKSNLSKSKEKVSVDGAEEKLLPKEEEAKIVTRVDMADAKYVVGDHRNGDAKIELDANKRQFSGLTKEELLKYADDPFWVRLRWFLFILFWAMWLAMLAGAIVIIVGAPKCYPPAPKTWFEKGPLVDMEEMSLADVEEALPQLQKSSVQGVFVDAPAYEALDQPDLVDKFKALFKKAKDHGVKVIVDLIPNYVSTDHPWFVLSQNRTSGYEDYFVWANGEGIDPATNKPNKKNKWVSMEDVPAWTWNEQRGQHYLHQYGERQADLNFDKPNVVEHFDGVITSWMEAGAAGIRLNKVRELLVDPLLLDEPPAAGSGVSAGADHSQRAFYRHIHTRDQPRLDPLLARWAALARTTAGTDDIVFTMQEQEVPELFLLARNATALAALRPKSAAPVLVQDDVTTVAEYINERLNDSRWPLIQLKASSEMESEVAALALLLPAAPVLQLSQLSEDNNATKSELLSTLVALRIDASVQHGQYALAPLPPRNSTDNKLLACARWKPGHTGYVAVLNPTATSLRANLTSLPSVPAALTVYHVSHQAKLQANHSSTLARDDVLVPAKSTVVLNYAPETTAEK